MNKSFKPTTAQGGFTLIELIVVIVILGILAATALPKFSSLGGDARVATLSAARGSLNSVVAMAHGKSLMGAGLTGNVTFEGVTVKLANGYPDAAQTTAMAAGLDVVNHPDFTMVTSTNTTAGTGGPAVSAATKFAIVPTALIGTANAAKCYIMYTEASSATVPPTVTLTGTADDCQ